MGVAGVLGIYKEEHPETKKAQAKNRQQILFIEKEIMLLITQYFPKNVCRLNRMRINSSKIRHLFPLPIFFPYNPG
jgi:hypothetical protein